METLVLVAQHRNQYYSRSKSRVSGRFQCSPSKVFRDINCRSFQFHSQPGILPTPITTNPCYSPKTPPFYNTNFNFEEEEERKSSTDEFSCSELWAGPTYCNSPPPSSLPMPKFSLRQKQSFSVELPVSPTGISMHRLIAKSAPVSPGRELALSPSDFASATKDLRRILHLDMDEEGV